MSDKPKQVARHIQHETGMTLRAAFNIVTGQLRLKPIAADCLVKRAIETLPDKLKGRAAMYDDGKSCQCPRCAP